MDQGNARPGAAAAEAAGPSPSPLAFAQAVLFTALPLAVVFFGSLFHPRDSDLGWHLRYGEYFAHHGRLLAENVLSTTMTSYRWVNPSWGTDLITYWAFTGLGFAGLSALGAAVATLGFWLAARAGGAAAWEMALLAPAFLFLEHPMLLGSFRAQSLTFPLLGALLFLAHEFEQGDRRRLFLVIPLFVLWTNLHGHFMLGLGLLGIWAAAYVCVRWYRTRAVPRGEIRTLGLVVTGSALATLLNPYGVTAHLETVRHLGDPIARYVLEWNAFPRFSPPWWTLAAWGGVLAAALVLEARAGSRADRLPFAVVALVLYAFSWKALRFAWPMYLASIPVIVPLLRRLRPQRAAWAQAVTALVLILSFGWVVQKELPRRGLRGMSWASYCRIATLCSPASAEFLERRPPAGNLLTLYDWGGWLIWRYPGVKPSVDGRMTVWRDASGYSAFEEYLGYEWGWRDVDASRYDVVYVAPNRPIFGRMMALVDEGRWEVAYADPLASVFVRKGRP
jgi:hypothetical protein